MNAALTREDWLRHGLEALAAEGFGALKADRLAKSLNVSRGSFYWHFRDLSDFHEGLLDLWERRATRQTIDQLERELPGTDRLQILMRGALAADKGLERGIRAWATHDPAVADRVVTIDRQRIAYLEKLLLDAGVGPDLAKARALFLHWAYLGQTLLSGGPFGSLDITSIDALAATLQLPLPDGRLA